MNFGAGKGGRIRETLRLALGTMAFFGPFWTALRCNSPEVLKAMLPFRAAKK